MANTSATASAPLRPWDSYMFDRHGTYMFDRHDTTIWSYHASWMARTSKYQKHLAAVLVQRPFIREESSAAFDAQIARAAEAHAQGDFRQAGLKLRAAQLLDEAFSSATAAKLQAFYAARIAKKLAANGGLKICTKCKKRRRLTSFDRQGAGLTGTIYRRSICKACAYKQQKVWRLKHPAKFQKQKKAARLKNGLKHHLKHRFGLTEAQFTVMFAACDGHCQICKLPEPRKRRLSLDHDHKTGRPRGFICASCNLLIGRAHDNPALLESAADYLRTADLSHLLSSLKVTETVVLEAARHA